MSSSSRTLARRPLLPPGGPAYEVAAHESCYQSRGLEVPSGAVSIPRRTQGDGQDLAELCVRYTRILKAGFVLWEWPRASDGPQVIGVLWSAPKVARDEPKRLHFGLIEASPLNPGPTSALAAGRPLIDEEGAIWDRSSKTVRSASHRTAGIHLHDDDASPQQVAYHIGGGGGRGGGRGFGGGGGGSGLFTSPSLGSTQCSRARRASPGAAARQRTVGRSACTARAARGAPRTRARRAGAAAGGWVARSRLAPVVADRHFSEVLLHLPRGTRRAPVLGPRRAPAVRGAAPRRGRRRRPAAEQTGSTSPLVRSPPSRYAESVTLSAERVERRAAPVVRFEPPFGGPTGASFSC